MADEDSTTLDGDLRMRIQKKELDIFTTRSQRVTGNDYQVLIREFITAFNDGRLRIIPTNAQKQTLKNIGELYDVN